MFPIDKYKFTQVGNTVYAASTYAGRVVKGKAMCAPEDTFDLEIGKRIAAARCAVKIAEKRKRRAVSKVAEARKARREARMFTIKMETYLSDASNALHKAKHELDQLLKD